jgi:hypothetical protein
MQTHLGSWHAEFPITIWTEWPGMFWMYILSSMLEWSPGDITQRG